MHVQLHLAKCPPTCDKLCLNMCLFVTWDMRVCERKYLGDCIQMKKCVHYVNKEVTNTSFHFQKHNFTKSAAHVNDMWKQQSRRMYWVRKIREFTRNDAHSSCVNTIKSISLKIFNEKHTFFHSFVLRHWGHDTIFEMECLFCHRFPVFSKTPVGVFFSSLPSLHA